MKQVFSYQGKKIVVYDSPRSNKQRMAILPSGKKIHFGDPDMKEYPNTKRGDNYCARSSGISSDNKLSANTLSRKILWKCKGKKSMGSYKDAGIKLIKKEEYFDSI